MELVEATWLAEEIRSWLAPGCVQIAIAGSIRRQRAAVKDIEIVAVPLVVVDYDLFDEPRYERSLLDGVLAELTPRRLRWAEPKRNGAKYKCLVVPSHDVTVDLFIAEEDNYGNILALRTGDAVFSRLLVTPRAHGGLLPDDLRHRQGYLWKGSTRLEAPTEDTFFAYFGITPVPAPSERNAALAVQLARQLATLSMRRSGTR